MTVRDKWEKALASLIESPGLPPGSAEPGCSHARDYQAKRAQKTSEL